MTRERMKSIGVLVATLIAGILLGLLVPGVAHNIEEYFEHRGHEKETTKERKGDWLTKTIYKVVKPDSAQKIKIKPVTEWAAARLDSIEQRANGDATHVLDSVRVQLRPLLTEEQRQRFEKFDHDAKKNWNRRGKEHKSH